MDLFVIRNSFAAMSEDPERCSFKFNPEIWQRENNGSCFVGPDSKHNERLLTHNADDAVVWRCPHEAVKGEDECMFHLSRGLDAKPDDATVADTFLEIVNGKREALDHDGPRPARFIGAEFKSLNLDAECVGDGRAIDLRHSDIGNANWDVETVEAEPLDMRGITVRSRWACSEVRLDGGARFTGAEFGGDALFTGAEFGGVAEFTNAEFGGTVLFGMAEFGEFADFTNAEFGVYPMGWEEGVPLFPDATFTNVEFTGGVYFNGAEFGGDARFHEAEFIGGGKFLQTEFSGNALFGGSKFGKAALFGGAKFEGDTNFNTAKFGWAAIFNKAEFSSETKFQEAEFVRKALFNWTEFDESVRFGEAEFGRKAEFGEVKFGGDAVFIRTEFGSHALFDKAEFRRDAAFIEADFRAGATFFIDGQYPVSQFQGDADFSHVTSGGSLRFVDEYDSAPGRPYTSLGQIDFREADASELEFSGVSFRKAPTFEGADLALANLSKCPLEGAIFENTNLTRADLSESDVSGAKFGGALLSRALLYGTNFTNAWLYGTRLEGAHVSDHTDFGVRNQLKRKRSSPIPFRGPWPAIRYDERNPKYDQFAEPESGEMEKEREGGENISDYTRAAAVYAEIERVAEANADSKLASRCYLWRKDMQRRHYWSDEGRGNRSEPLRWTRSWLANVFVRYGESPWRVTSIAGLVIVGCAVLYYLFGLIEYGTSPLRTGLPIGVGGGAPQPIITFLDALYFSTLTFSTLGMGTFQPIGPVGRAVAVFETLSGVVLLALLVFVFGRRATR